MLFVSNPTPYLHANNVVDPKEDIKYDMSFTLLPSFLKDNDSIKEIIEWSNLDNAVDTCLLTF